MLNRLKLQPGERFVTKVNRREFEIQKVQNGNVVVKDLASGQNYIYGADALKRLLIMEEQA